MEKIPSNTSALVYFTACHMLERKAMVVIIEKNNFNTCISYYNKNTSTLQKKCQRRQSGNQRNKAPHLFAVAIAPVELLGLHLALHHGVNGLQVRRVGHHRQADVLVGHTVQTLVRHAQVVLDVPGPFIGRLQLGVKLTDDLLQGLPTHIGQDIQATSGRQIGNCIEGRATTGRPLEDCDQ